MSTDQIKKDESEPKRTHNYHAEATALCGELTHPVHQVINPQAHAKLQGQHDGYLSQQSEGFRIEQVITYRSAYAQVAGRHALKAGQGFDPSKTFAQSDKAEGWRTLSTSVIEGLNILNILTVDRIVSQVSTVHPKKGHLPTISFLGTQFQNFRLAGKEVKLNLDLDVLGDKPVVVGGRERIGIPKDACPHLEPHFLRLQPHQYKRESVEGKGRIEVSYGSLVTSSQVGDGPVTQGPLIDLPNFGKIYLAPFKLTQSEFGPISKGSDEIVPHRTHLEIKMLAVRMGCIADGDADTGSTVVGGITEP